MKAKNKATYEDKFDAAQRTKKKGKNFIIYGIVCIALVLFGGLFRIYFTYYALAGIVFIPVGIGMYFYGSNKAREVQVILDKIEPLD